MVEDTELFCFFARTNSLFYRGGYTQKRADRQGMEVIR